MLTERALGQSARVTKRLVSLASPFHVVASVSAARRADDLERRLAHVRQGERAVAGHGSRPDEIRVLGLQPVAAFPAVIEAARPLRHDAFEAEFARLGEHERARWRALR